MSLPAPLKKKYYCVGLGHGTTTSTSRFIGRVSLRQPMAAEGLRRPWVSDRVSEPHVPSRHSLFNMLEDIVRR